MITDASLRRDILRAARAANGTARDCTAILKRSRLWARRAASYGIDTRGTADDDGLTAAGWLETYELARSASLQYADVARHCARMAQIVEMRSKEFESRKG